MTVSGSGCQNMYRRTCWWSQDNFILPAVLGPHLITARYSATSTHFAENKTSACHKCGPKPTASVKSVSPEGDILYDGRTKVLHFTLTATFHLNLGQPVNHVLVLVCPFLALLPETKQIHFLPFIPHQLGQDVTPSNCFPGESMHSTLIHKTPLHYVAIRANFTLLQSADQICFVLLRNKIKVYRYVPPLINKPLPSMKYANCTFRQFNHFIMTTDVNIFHVQVCVFFKLITLSKVYCLFFKKTTMWVFAICVQSVCIM